MAVLDKNTSNIILRVISGTFIFFIFMVSLFILPQLFYFLMSCIFIGMIYEWHNITKSNFYIWLMGLALVIPILALDIIKYCFLNSPMLILWYFLIIWTTDVMAMVGGKTIGGWKLAPVISPNKTWSGFFVGTFAASFVGGVTYEVMNFYNVNLLASLDIIEVLYIGFAIACMGQASDLSISIVKRKFNVKDSGNFIPGHGGFLDRFDSIIITAPIFLLILYYI